MNYSPLTDLELFELIVAAYPEKFAAREEVGDDLWDEVMEFVEEGLCREDFQDWRGLAHFLGRIVMLTHPMQSAVSGTHRHVLGKLVKVDGGYLMTAAVCRSTADQPVNT